MQSKVIELNAATTAATGAATCALRQVPHPYHKFSARAEQHTPKQCKNKSSAAPPTLSSLNWNSLGAHKIAAFKMRLEHERIPSQETREAGVSVFVVEYRGASSEFMSVGVHNQKSWSIVGPTAPGRFKALHSGTIARLQSLLFW